MPASWERIEEIFNAAAELPRSERAAFLDRVCGGDADLRREVESLLAHDDPGDPVIASAVAAAANTQRLPIGRMIGPYRITAVLGEGGMGVVYRAWDTELDRTVALKLLTPDRLGDIDRKRRFIQEAKAASSLNHPHIVTIHTITREGDSECIVMEYVAGTTLAEAIPEKGLPLMDALRLGLEIADALAAAHAAGIVHRDLKPSNIMVTESGRAKVLDFGLAKSLEPAGNAKSAPSTEAGKVFGTPAYMSPEQAQGQKVDARTDIFSFGCVLYEMLTGRRAFQGDSALSTLAAILRGEPERMRSDPLKVEKVVQRCLRKEPEGRFQRMEDVRADLRKLMDGVDSSWFSRRIRLGWFQAAALAAGLIALGLAGLAVYRSVTSTAPPMKIVPLITNVEGPPRPSFSPDGGRVALSGGADGAIYVKVIGAGEPVRVSNGILEFWPVWSPDGRFIAFLRMKRLHFYDVVIIPAMGGAERIVAAISVGIGNFRLDWTPDGQWLVASHREGDDSSHAVFLISVETGEKRRLTRPPASGYGDEMASISPDGRTLLFSRKTSASVGDLSLQSLTTGYFPEGEPMRLTFETVPIRAAVWLPNSREILFLSQRSGSPGLWKVAANRGSPPRQVVIPAQVADHLAISPKGDRLLFMQSADIQQLWKVPLPGSGAKAVSPQEFLRSTRRESNPHFSPDGNRVAFASNRSGSAEIWVCDRNAQNLVQFTSFGGPSTGSPRWSPDGAWIALHSQPQGNSDIFVIGANGGKPRRLTTDAARDRIPRWSRDGKWVYFSSNRSGRDEIWRAPAAGGEAAQVTRNGGYAALESPDGKFLYYMKQEGESGLWRMPVRDGVPDSSAGGESEVLKSVFHWWNLELAVDGIYFIRLELAKYFELASYRVADRQTKSILRFMKTPFGLTVSPDQRAALLALLEENAGELMLVENFHP